MRVHARLLSIDANSSLWQKVAHAGLLRRKLLDSSPSLRSGLIRIELLYQSVNAPRKWLAEYNVAQDRLRATNAFCTHERIALRSWGPEFAAADIYHCDSEFVTLPPSEVAVGVACNVSRTSVFCPHSQPHTHPVGFASFAALEHEEASAKNQILNLSRVPTLAVGRPHAARVAQMLRTDESAAASSADAGEDCQDFQYLRGALEQSLLGPRLGAALTDRNRSSAVHVLSSDPLVVQILDFITDDERAALLQSVDRAIGATASSEVAVLSRSSPRPEQSLASNSSEILASLDARARELTGFPLVDEPLVLRYRHADGQTVHEPAHVDWFPLRAGQSRALGARGQRTATLLLALDSVANSQRDGGAISFPRLLQPLLVHPRRNAALLIYNVRANGDGDWRTAHGVTPIVAPGVAWTGVALFMRDPRLVGPHMACPLPAADGDVTV